MAAFVLTGRDIPPNARPGGGYLGEAKLARNAGEMLEASEKDIRIGDSAEYTVGAPEAVLRANPGRSGGI
mgnify:CR=1 FL=1